MNYFVARTSNLIITGAKMKLTPASPKKKIVLAPKIYIYQKIAIEFTHVIGITQKKYTILIIPK
jgi:hypothetical protein